MTYILVGETRVFIIGLAARVATTKAGGPPGIP